MFIINFFNFINRSSSISVFFCLMKIMILNFFHGFPLSAKSDIVDIRQLHDQNYFKQHNWVEFNFVLFTIHIKTFAVPAFEFWSYFILTSFFIATCLGNFWSLTFKFLHRAPAFLNFFDLQQPILFISLLLGLQKKLCWYSWIINTECSE